MSNQPPIPVGSRPPMSNQPPIPVGSRPPLSALNTIVDGSQVIDNSNYTGHLITVQNPNVANNEQKVMVPPPRALTAPSDDCNDDDRNVVIVPPPRALTAPSDDRNDDDRSAKQSERRQSYTPPPRLAMKEHSTALKRHRRLHEMKKSKRFTHRMMHRLVVVTSFLDPIIWCLSFFAIYFFVRPTIVNPDRTGWELTRRVRSLTFGWDSVQDSDSMWSYFRGTLFPSLAPSAPSIEMVNTYMDFVVQLPGSQEHSTGSTNVQTLNDGRLTVISSSITIRQVRRKNLFRNDDYTEEDYTKKNFTSWLIGNLTAISNDLTLECPERLSDIEPIFVSATASKNTETFSP